MPTKKTVATNSPVTSDLSRAIPSRTAVQLYVAAGGRCEFDGCNRDLFHHPVTQETGNYGERAHIVGFREGGPRGRELRPASIHEIENLMALCPQCHRLVDRRPNLYTRETLQRYKRDHEVRVFQLLELAPKNLTTVLVFLAPIGSHVPSVDRSHILRALAPAYPNRPDPITIDLRGITTAGRSFFPAAKGTITSAVHHLMHPGMDRHPPTQLSLFALGPIPLLAFLGRTLGNKIPLHLFQRHRGTEDWTWKETGTPVRYSFRALRQGTNKSRVALLLSLSARVRPAALPKTVGQDYSLYEIGLATRKPIPTFLRRRDDLVLFKDVYQRALAEIASKHPGLQDVVIFAAVPAPIAVLCGREPFGRAGPDLLVYDYDASRGYHSPIRIKTS